VIVAAVALGGVVGALGRYGLSFAVPAEAGRYPWGTFVINLSGSAVLGFLLVLLVEQFPRGRLARPFVGTGILGAYTTFSTFVVDAVLLVRDHHAGTASVYVLASVIGGLGAVLLGMTTARLVVKAERLLQESSP
jgi:CrcB protein